MPYSARDAAPFALMLATLGFIATMSAHGQAPEAATATPPGKEQAATKPPARVFPAEPDSAFVGRLKRDAERTYDRGNYERAFRLYRYGLAWRGDKYAQYMVGYMTFNGQGRSADRVRGTAWLQLAAERGDDDKLNAVFADARSRLSDDERHRADDVHDDLRADFGDRKVLRRLIRADRSALRDITGTRTGASDMLALTITLPNGQSVPAAAYYNGIKERIRLREDFLGGRVTLGSFQVLDEAPVDEAAPEDGDDATAEEK